MRKSAKHKSEKSSNPALSRTMSIIISDGAVLVESKDGFVRHDDVEDEAEFSRTRECEELGLWGKGLPSALSNGTVSRAPSK